MSTSPFDDPCLPWRKAERSSGGGDDCVDVARVGDLSAIRDSKHTHLRIVLERANAKRFARNIKAGRYDR